MDWKHDPRVIGGQSAPRGAAANLLKRPSFIHPPNSPRYVETWAGHSVRDSGEIERGVGRFLYFL